MTMSKMIDDMPWMIKWNILNHLYAMNEWLLVCKRLGNTWNTYYICDLYSSSNVIITLQLILFVIIKMENLLTMWLTYPQCFHHNIQINYVSNNWFLSLQSIQCNINRSRIKWSISRPSHYQLTMKEVMKIKHSKQIIRKKELQS